MFLNSIQKQEAQVTTYGSRIINKDKKLKMTIGESSDESDDELADLAIRKEEDFKAVKGMPGMYYKVYRPNIAIGKCHSK